jgi:multiple sugar transport system permease protein
MTAGLSAPVRTAPPAGPLPARSGAGLRRGARIAGRVGPLLPAVVLIAVFLAGPILWCCYAAFTNSALTGVGAGAGGGSLVGLANFKQMLGDPAFRQSVILTIVFVGGSAVIGQNILGLLIAVLMRGRNQVFRSVIGSVVVAAWVVPEIVAAFVWYAYLNNQGELDGVLAALHLPHPAWLYTYPILSVTVANIWRGTAFSMLVYSAAIAEVPPDLLEAAAVDGANTLQRMRRVTLPLMKRSIATNLMLVTLQTLSVFTLVFAMTGGGPGTKSQTLPVYMYQEAFKYYQLGYGAAVALVLLLIGALFSIVYVRVLKVEA